MHGCGTESHFIPQSVTKMHNPVHGSDPAVVPYTVVCDCEHLQDPLAYTMLGPRFFMVLCSVRTLILHCAAGNAWMLQCLSA
jgi:hypothetical protein